MEEGERSPLLSQDAAGLKPSLCNSGPASSGPGPSLSMGSSCAKYLIVLSNFLSSLVGLLALLGGLWGLAVKGSSGSAQGGPLPEAPALGLVLAGLAVSAVSLAGCLGALCESRCLLSCFSGAVLACLVLEALAGALVLALWGPLRDGLAHTLHVAVIRYQDDPDLRFLLDQVQLGLQCCGAASYQDWRQNLCFNCSSPAAQACGVPASCCIHPREAGAAVSARCGLGALRLDQRVAARAVHLRGCGPALRRWLRAHARTAGACAAAVLVVQGAELLWASWLLRALAALEATAGTRAFQNSLCSLPQLAGLGETPSQDKGREEEP